MTSEPLYMNVRMNESQPLPNVYVYPAVLLVL